MMMGLSSTISTFGRGKFGLKLRQNLASFLRRQLCRLMGFHSRRVLVVDRSGVDNAIDYWDLGRRFVRGADPDLQDPVRPLLYPASASPAGPLQRDHAPDGSLPITTATDRTEACG